MSGTPTPTAPSSAAAPAPVAPRRYPTVLPVLVLVAVLGATMWFAFDHEQDLDRAQTELEQSARQEFGSSVESARNHVLNEVDRLTELLTGIVAFSTSSGDSDAATVSRYLELTGARERFPGLVDVVLVQPSSPTVPAPDTRGESDDTGIVTASVSASGEITAVTFGLASQTDPVWISLLFDSDRFLGRALASGHTGDTMLVNTGLPTEGQAAGSPSAEVPVLIAQTDDGTLMGQALVDVFGTGFIVEVTAHPELVRSVGSSQLWLLLLTGTGIALGLYFAVRWLTQSRATALAVARNRELQFRAVDRRFKASFESSPVGMAEIDLDGRVIAANPALCAQIGRDVSAVLGRELSEFVHQDDRADHDARLAELFTGVAHSTQGEHRFRHEAGHEVWVSQSVSVISGDAAGGGSGSAGRSLLVQSQDITAQRRASWELAQQALHDELTGLPNRALFLNRLRHALVRAGRRQSRVAVMFMDVDRFKLINDTLGHDVGDSFLMQIAERLGIAVRAGDTVARFGGDEFVVLCEDVEGESEAAAVAQRIQASFARPFDLDNTPTYATASLGITLNGPNATADTMLRDADAAMYRAKETGRSRTEMFDASMRTSLMARREIESQLRSALSDGEIVMHYHAIVSPDTHLPVGYEGLIRWNHPEKGLLGPGAFLSVAEEAGLIDLIDSFALRTTCRQIASWVRDYPAARNLYVTTNWSARHLGRFVQQVEQVLQETRINPHQLVIEVTESFLLEDTDASVKAIEQLKHLGVQIAIDDFGTGYSSLAYLTQFSVDFLKIDQSFVSKLPDDEGSAAIIGAIADLATRLGIGLVAEGVETDEQIAMLETLGKPRLQGYRFAKPRPAADIEYHLAQRSQSVERIARGAERLLASP